MKKGNVQNVVKQVSNFDGKNASDFQQYFGGIKNELFF